MVVHFSFLSHCHTLFVLSCFFLVSCSQSVVSIKKSSPASYSAEKAERVKPSSVLALETDTKEQAWPDALSLKWKQILQTNLCSLSQGEERQSFIGSVQSQLQKNPEQFPIVSQRPLFLPFESGDRSFRSQLVITAPETRTPSSPLIIILSDSIPPPSEIVQRDGAWILHLQPRPQLQFSLLGERDFLDALSSLFSYYPFLQAAPKYLVGQGETTFSAFFLASQYRGWISGLAVSGGKMPLSLPNLDDCPLYFFESSHPQQNFYSLEKVASYWKERGNGHVLVLQGDVGTFLDAVVQVDHTAPIRVPPCRFTLGSGNWITPWLRVVDTNFTADQATIEVVQQEDALLIRGENLAEIEILADPLAGFPRKVKRLFFHDELHPIDFASSFRAYGGQERGKNEKKIAIPGGWKQFFTSSPLYVIYQDQHESAHFIEKARQLSIKLSKRAFSGLPPLFFDALPVLPLSKYKPEELPFHRSILIGDSSLFSRIEHSPQYVPALHTLFPSLPSGAEVACGYLYPPRKGSHLMLSCFLTAEDGEGLDVLSEHYANAISLFDSSDVMVWKKESEKEGYLFFDQYQFDGYWGLGRQHRDEICLPSRTKKEWEKQVMELLHEQTGEENILASSLVSFLPPSIAFRAQLLSYFPNHHFVTFSFEEEEREKMESFCRDLQKITGREMHFSPHYFPVTITTDMHLLSQFDPLFFRDVHYSLFPFSLRELVDRSTLFS